MYMKAMNFCTKCDCYFAVPGTCNCYAVPKTYYVPNPWITWTPYVVPESPQWTYTTAAPMPMTLTTTTTAPVATT